MSSGDDDIPEGSCVIVDGYRSGAALIRAFQKIGVRNFVHIDADLPHWQGAPLFDEEDFQDRLVSSPEGNPEEFAQLVEQLRLRQPFCIVPGTETGVELADRLSHALSLISSNGIEKSHARRSKDEMVEVVREAGLVFAHSWRLDKAEDVLRLPVGIPLVFKPLRSAGGDGVTLCETPEQREEAFSRIISTPDKLGHANHGVLAQEYLTGAEYIVDTCSCAGRHRVAAIWEVGRVSRNGWAFLCETSALVPDTEVPPGLIDYSFQVLDALGIAYGPAHIEIRLRTPKGPPVLIEVGARLHGSCFSELTEEAVEDTQHGLAAQAYARPFEFRDEKERPYHLKKHLCTLEWILSKRVVICNTDARLAAVAELKSLASHHCDCLPDEGETFQPTTDVLNSPGWVALQSDCPLQLQRDLEAARRLGSTILCEQ